MAQATDGNSVHIHYSGKLKDGTLFDSSEGGDPLQFTIGQGNIIPKLEAAVVGMAVGDKASVEIAAEDACGPRHDDAVQQLHRSSIPEGIEFSVGKQLQASTENSETVVLTVVALDETTATLDANHPLAGEDLFFEGELFGIKGVESSGA